jgi:hypothetical protein
MLSIITTVQELTYHIRQFLINFPAKSSDLHPKRTRQNTEMIFMWGNVGGLSLKSAQSHGKTAPDCRKNSDILTRNTHKMPFAGASPIFAVPLTSYFLLAVHRPSSIVYRRLLGIHNHA